MGRPGPTLLAAAAALLLACSDVDTATPPVADRESGPLSVFVVHYPLAYFAERIGGDSVEVTFPAPPHLDPAFWSPDPETIALYQGADLILLNGAGYAGWTELATLPRAALVDTSGEFAYHLIERADTPVHQHGPEGEHSHGALAFTIWLDPQLAILQARAIAEAFARERPGQRADFESRLAALENDLATLDEHVKREAERIGAAPLLFSHPVYAYLERHYDLNGRSLHWEPDEAPDEAAWRELDLVLDEHPARWLIWEAEPLPATRAALAERGLESVVFAPAGNVPESGVGDYLSVMRSNAENLARIRP